MAELVFTTIASLDGFVADASGNFDWGAPGDEVHAFVNDLERPVGTYLYGRRMYDVMVAWESDDLLEGASATVLEYAQIWRAADKVVFSRTLETPVSERTRIEHDFDPEAVRRLKEESDRPLSVGGPELAAEAMRAGLVDEIGLVLAPVIVGGGNPVFKPGIALDLSLLEERAFSNGMVYLRYAVAAAG